MKFATTIFIVLIAGYASAQKFVGESKLPAIENDGFYRVALSPSLTSRLNNRFSNIRIHDEKGSEVPYLFEEESASKFTTTFKQYGIVEKSQRKNCCTTLILANEDGHAINNISLSIKNAEVSKQASLLGSDDQQTWYALKDKFTISGIASDNSTSELRIVDFPLSNYSFYKIEIADSLTAPLNILAAGYYETRSEEGKYTTIPVRSLQKDSAILRKSFITLTFDSSRVVDRLVIAMQGAPYFLREAQLFTKKKRINRKKVTEYYDEYVTSFVLSSKQSSVIELNTELVKEFRIVVDNNDNPPLQISKVESFQLNRYLTAWLKSGQSYSVLIGPFELQTPVYDIGHFKDNIPVDIKTLNPSPLVMSQQYAAGSPKTFFTSSIFVWAAIVLVIGVLGFMAIRMVKETSARQQ